MSILVYPTFFSVAGAAIFFLAFFNCCGAVTVSVSRRHRFEIPSSKAETLHPLNDKYQFDFYNAIENCGVVGNTARGAILRILSDLSGGTPLESIKCRVTVTKDNMFQVNPILVAVTSLIAALVPRSSCDILKNTN